MRVVWTRKATGDLAKIKEYISEDKAAAARAVGSLVRISAKRLGTFPQIGRQGRVEGTRELIIPGTPLIVVYQVQRQ